MAVLPLEHGFFPISFFLPKEMSQQFLISYVLEGGNLGN